MFHKFTLVAPVWFQMVPGDKLHSEKVGFPKSMRYLIGWDYQPITARHYFRKPNQENWYKNSRRARCWPWLDIWSEKHWRKSCSASDFWKMESENSETASRKRADHHGKFLNLIWSCRSFNIEKNVFWTRMTEKEDLEQEVFDG